jgi:hypothetical protein
MAVSAPVVWVPLVDLTPAKLPPDAVQVLALTDCQVSVADAPLITDVGAAFKVTVGAGTTVTVCVTGELVPPGPVQVIEKLVAPPAGRMLRDPPLASVPLQPPEAVHEVAPVELQLNVAAAPAAIWVGAAASEAVGTAGGGAALSLPPPPQASRISAAHTSAGVDTCMGIPELNDV